MYLSDDMWVVAVLETDERCGDTCAVIKREAGKAAAAADGAVQYGYVNPMDVVVAPDGQFVEVYQTYNINATPTLLVFAPGRKTDVQFRVPLVIPADAAVSMLQHGARLLHENVKQFMPSLVTSGVRARALDGFFTSPAPALPRVLLFVSADKAGDPRAGSPPLPLRKLAIDFAARAVFGTARLNDEDMAAAFGASFGSRLFVSPPGPLASLGGDGTGAPPAPGAAARAGWRKYDGGGGPGAMGYPALRRWLNATLPPPAVPQLASDGDFERVCGGASGAGVCFLAVVPPSAADAAAAGRGGPLAEFTAVAGSNFVIPDYDTIQVAGGYTATRPPVAFAWVDADAQEAFADGFGVVAPGVVAVNTRKKVFAVLKQSLQRSNVEAFLWAMMTHRPGIAGGSTGDASAEETFRALVDLRPIPAIPKLVKQVPRAALDAALGGKKKRKGAAGGGEEL